MYKHDSAKHGFFRNIAISFIAAGTLLSSAAVFADSQCKNAKLVIANNYLHNGTPMKIKVSAVNYKDFTDKVWREKTFSDTVIENSANATVVQDLIKVENEVIHEMQVQFRWKDSGSAANWSDPIWSNWTHNPHGTNVCATNAEYNISVTSRGSKGS